MSGRVQRVPYHLDARGIKELPREELVAILRGADDLIMSGGCNLLMLVLKGSRQKKLVELGLDQSPVYGYYRDLAPEEILASIDWAIIHGYLDIAYDNPLPLPVLTEVGWEIERETRA